MPTNTHTNTDLRRRRRGSPQPVPADEILAAFVVRTTAASNVPVFVEDPVAIDQIARVLS
jgi:hypothetical protein